MRAAASTTNPRCPVVARSPKLRLCSYFSFSAFDLGSVLYERTKTPRITATRMNGPDNRLFNVLRVSLLISYAYYKLPI
jgi:hypothetical protein